MNSEIPNDRLRALIGRLRKRLLSVRPERGMVNVTAVPTQRGGRGCHVLHPRGAHRRPRVTSSSAVGGRNGRARGGSGSWHSFPLPTARRTTPVTCCST